MIASVIGFLVIAPPQTVCPVMGHDVPSDSPRVLYKGVSYGFCCGGCEPSFKANPEKYAHKDGSQIIGWSVYDPVARQLVVGSPSSGKETSGKYTSDYRGVRYYFLSEKNKAAFDAEPAKYASAPKKEAYSECPVMGTKLSAEKLPPAYRDYNGVRYYFCCGSCPAKFDSDPAKYASKVSASDAQVRPMPKIAP